MCLLGAEAMRKQKEKRIGFDLPANSTASIGVDWITATQFRIDDVKPLLKVAKGIVSKEVQRGNDRRTWKGQGYFGERAGGASWGVRGDTYIAMLSSGCARENWREVGEWATNCTRLDLQQTILLEEEDRGFFDRMEAFLLSRPAGRGRSAQVTRVRDSKGGNTLYLGSRTSDVYYRVYDKGVESGTYEPGRLIRFEIELKRDLAKTAMLNVLRSKSEKDEILSIIAGLFGRQSVNISSSYVQLLEVACVDSSSDVQQRLRYLAKSVRPLVQKLISAGFEDEAMACLFAKPGDYVPPLAEETKPWWGE